MSRAHPKAEDVERVLEWVKTCPFDYHISSISTGNMHMKLHIPVEEVVKLQGFDDEGDQS